MRLSGVIRIKRRTQPEWLLWLIFVMPFLFGTLFNLLRLPMTLKYLLDVAWVFLILYLIRGAQKDSSRKRFDRILGLWIIALLIYTLIAYIANYRSGFYYVWGLRNNFRYYVVFFAVATFIKKSDIQNYWSLLEKLFWVNAVISLVQYLVFGVYGDNLGGLFGTGVGCNAYTNVFFVIISSQSLVWYLNKRESLKRCAAKCAAMFVIAAFAELKFFYIEFILIVVLTVLVTDFSWRKLSVILFGSIGVLLGVYALTFLFPNSAGFFSVDGILKIAASEKGYTSSGDLNRLTAIPIISNRFLKTLPQKLFGLGLGNCDTAGYSFLVSPFYSQYAHLRYQWFSIAFWFLETGYIGLTLFYGFFVVVIVRCLRMKKTDVSDKCCLQTAIIVAFCCMMIAIYNSTLRMEAGYMAYFVLALPFITDDSARRRKRKLNSMMVGY